MPHHHLRILDVDLTLRGPAACVDPIGFAYRRFAVATPATDAIEIALEPGPPGFVVAGDRRVGFVHEHDAVAQLYRSVLDVLMRGLGAHAVVHAAALAAPGGAGLLLAAPSGHGKSSLCLELARRGFGFLGDDCAPVDLARREIQPYPRALGFTEDGARRAGLDRQPDLPSAVLMGKRLVDPGDLLGEASIVRRPVPLRYVFLLSDCLERVQLDTTIRLAARREDATDLEAKLGAVAGAQVLQRDQRGGIVHWELRLDPAATAAGDLSRLLENDRVLFVEKSWQPRPRFSAPPAAEPIGRREAAEHLGREVLNRRVGGRLLERYGGSLAALFVDLAAALSGAECFLVRVGDRAATAALLSGLVIRRPPVDAADSKQ